MLIFIGLLLTMLERGLNSMYRVIDVNDSGKTKRLLEECSYKNGIFVCNHPERVLDKCLAYNIDFNKIKSVYGYSEFIKKSKYLSLDDEVYIDDLEKFIKEAYGDRVHGYSLTVGD